MNKFLASLSNTNTKRAYASVLEKVEENHGCVSSETAIQYITTRALQISPYTLKVEIAALRSYFSWEVSEGIRKEIPVFPSVITPNRKPAAAGIGDVEALLASVPTDSCIGARDHAIISTLFFGCARSNTVVNLSLSDYIKFENKKLLYKTKRMIPVHPRLEASLERYLSMSRLRHENGWFFRSFKDRGTRMTAKKLDRTDVTRIVKARAHQAGIKRLMTADMVRAASLSSLLGKGVAAQDVAIFAGHSGDHVTKRHAPAIERDVDWKRLLRKLDF